MSLSCKAEDEEGWEEGRRYRASVCVRKGIYTSLKRGPINSWLLLFLGSYKDIVGYTVSGGIYIAYGYPSTATPLMTLIIVLG